MRLSSLIHPTLRPQVAVYCLSVGLAPALALASGQGAGVLPDSPGSALPTGSDAAAPSTEQPAPPPVDAALQWADWSGDGLVDAWAVQPDGSGLLLKNAGDGSFTDETAAAGLGDVRGVHGAAWADVDGDNRLDLFLPSWSGVSRLYLQGDGGMFVEITRSSGISPHARPVHARWVDFDGDGLMDLHLSTLREDIVYRGLGRAQFEQVELGLIPRSGLGAGPGGRPLDQAPSPLRPGGPNTAASVGGSVTVTNITPSFANSAGSGSGICAGTIEDVATGNCINASSAPQLGTLYPLSTNFNVGSNGFVGIGTTSRPDRLTVAGSIRGQRVTLTAGNGTAPLTVSSTTRVNNLNADLLDGLSASAFRSAGSAITSSDISNGTIVNADVASNAAIAGTKVNPNFGNQEIETNGGLDIAGGSTSFRTAIISNPTGGPALRVNSATVGSTSTDPCLNVNTQARGSGILLVQSNSTASLPGLDVNTFSSATAHRAARLRKTGAAAGHVVDIVMTNSTASGDTLNVDNAGSGRGAFIRSGNGTGLEVDRASNTGLILVARNGNDIEFKVESSGDVFCDGAFTGGGADYAEWLPVAPGESMPFQKGDVVGVHGGEISHDLDGADTLLVVSTNPCLVGNNVDAETSIREGHEVVAFLGQVPVRMRGTVRKGDLVLPSGHGDGTAVAVRPADLKPSQLGDVIGRAWGCTTESGGPIQRVTCAIGLERDSVASLALESVRDEMEAMRSTMGSVLARLEALEMR